MGHGDPDVFIFRIMFVISRYVGGLMLNCIAGVASRGIQSGIRKTLLGHSALNV